MHTTLLIASALFAVVSFKDANKIKSWDAWTDHEGPKAWTERRCVTLEKIRKMDPGLERIGQVKPRNSREDFSAKWSVDCATLDRDYADWEQFKHLLPELGVKHARLMSGWAKTEQERGKYDFAWLDVHVREMTAMGIRPWMTLSYGNPVWGGDFRLGMRVSQVTEDPEAFAAWLRYVEAVVTRYKDVIDEWEVWNEPFDQTEHYMKLLVETAKVVKRVQPTAKCICTAIQWRGSPEKSEYKVILDELKRTNQLNLVDRWVFHPYWGNPDDANEEADALGRLVRSYSPAYEEMQGETGCPSQLEYAHALAEEEWTEYAQAKWDLRRAMGDAARGRRSSVFSFIDLQYTFMLQSFGLVRSNALKEPVYRRPSYFAMQTVYALFDDTVKPLGFKRLRVNGRRFSIASFEKDGKPMRAVWFSDKRPGDGLAYERVDLKLLGLKGKLTWTDLMTGRVYALPSLDAVPVWDSPVLITAEGVDTEIGWRRYEDLFTWYRKAIAENPNEATYLEEFDTIAAEVGISVSERYRMLKSHHAALRTRPTALLAECATGVFEGDYDSVIDVMRSEKSLQEEGADVFAGALLLKGHELEAEGDLAGARRLYAEAHAGADTSLCPPFFYREIPKDPSAAELSYRKALDELKAGDAAAARADLIRALTLKNDFLWAKVALGACEPDARPKPNLPKIGVLRRTAAPDPRDNQWMIGCELLDRDFTDFNAYKDHLPALGIRKARFQCGWAKCERTKGAYDFAWLDACADFCLAHGMEPVFETDYGNPLYPGGGGTDLSGGFPSSAEALAAWDRWVDALTRHFRGRVREWAMWNEPDIAPLRTVYAADQSKSPEAIAAFNLRTARIVKRNIPDARIAGLSLNASDPAFFERCLAALGADVKLFDSFIYHGYDIVPEASYANVRKLQEICARLAPHARMWQGENGAPSGRTGDELALSHIWWTEGTQAKWDLRRMIGDLVVGVPSGVFTICDYYHFGRGIGNFGLLRAGNSRRVLGRKLAFGAVANCASVFNGDAEAVPEPTCIRSPDPRLVRREFRRKGRHLIAFWFGGERPSETTRLEEVRMDALAFEDPVWVDLMSGAVYAFPKGRELVPVCDSPCLLAERAALEIEDAGRNPS